MPQLRNGKCISTQDDVFNVNDSDMEEDKSNFWLTDQHINCYFSHLKNSFNLKSKKIFLFDPIITALVRLNFDNSICHLNSLKIKKYDYLVLPVNDSNVNSNGTHWSLLLYIKNENKFYHFDSIRHLNFDIARDLACNVSKYLNFSFNIDQVCEVDCAQQNNTYDCGVYLLYFCQQFIFHLIIFQQFTTVFNPPDCLTLIREFLLESNYNKNNTSDIKLDDSFDTVSEKELDGANENESDQSAPINLYKDNEQLHITTQSYNSKILLLGDSHMRSLASLLSSKVDENVSVMGIFKPNATFNSVISDVHDLAKDFTKNDSIYIMAGTNDISQYYYSNKLNFNLNSLADLNSKTNLNFILIPYRFDHLSFLNESVYLANMSLWNFARVNNINVIDTSRFERNLFTNHGLHLSRLGKEQLAKHIYDDVKYVAKLNHIPVICSVRDFHMHHVKRRRLRTNHI